MEFIDNILLLIGSEFNREPYMLFTKIQGILWSIANTLIVFYFLKITGLIRIRQQGKPIRFRYFFLLITVILSPFLLFTDSNTVFFALEAAIYGIQYSILLYTLALERKEMMYYFKGIIFKGNPIYEKEDLQPQNQSI